MSRSLPCYRSIIGLVVTVCASLGAVACGGSDVTNPSKQSVLSAQEASVVASAMFSEVSRAIASSGVALDATPASAAFTTAPLSGTVNISSSCTSGGTLTGTYTYSENIAATGSGTASGTVSVTAHGCEVSTGTRTIGVDGQLTFAFDMTLAQNAALDSFDWHATGSFTWDGGNCSMDYTIKYAGGAAGQSSFTGTVCGTKIG